MPPAIGLLGDVMLGRKVAEHLEAVPPPEVWAPQVRRIAASCDLVICNLECCISGRGEPTALVSGKPFFFRAPPHAVESLEAIGVGMVGVANNHALDFGPEALIDTLEFLGEASIAAAGAGADIESARRGAIVERRSARVGLLALSDHPRQFAAGPAEPGVAFAELHRGLPDWVADELAELRARSDLVIAFPHWGPNMTAAPAPWQLRAARELQLAGADLIAGHSAHVFHGIGWGERGPLLYDLGDALDDYAIDRQLRNDLGVMAIWQPGGGERELELVPLRLDYCRTGLAEGDDAEWIVRRLDHACSELGTRVERLAEARFAIVPA
jgi:poly-gamma-glutamate capsule biosynthesis protein CapA/YwtB (metallophosphatase superfamily)